jgi:hypothetical protein
VYHGGGKAALSQESVLKLAKKITAVLNTHPKAQEAVTACSIATELAKLRAKLSLGIPIRMNHRLK